MSEAVNPWAAGASSILDFAGKNIMSNSANAKSKRNAMTQFWMQKYFIDYQNEYNSPENQMKRLRDAGLNPNLVYDNGNAVIASAGPSGGAMADVTPADGTFNVLGKMQALASVKQQEASIAETEARTDAIDENIQLKKDELDLRREATNLLRQRLNDTKSVNDIRIAKLMAEIKHLNNKFDWKNPNDWKKGIEAVKAVLSDLSKETDENGLLW